jgi:hypothetical protein
MIASFSIIVTKLRSCTRFGASLFVTIQSRRNFMAGDLYRPALEKKAGA